MSRRVHAGPRASRHAAHERGPAARPGARVLDSPHAGLRRRHARPPRPQRAGGPGLASRLTSIKPALPSRDGTITLTGPGHQHQQRAAWSGRRPCSGATRPRSPTATVSTRPSTRRRTIPLGSRLVNRARSRTSTPPTTPTWRRASRPTSASTAKVADLALAPTDGVYLMGVHVTAERRAGRRRPRPGLRARARRRSPTGPADDLARRCSTRGRHWSGQGCWPTTTWPARSRPGAG